jgi:UDP-glucose 4-epimerase
MRVEYQNARAATDEIIYHNFERLLEFRIGDVREFSSIASALRDADVVVNAAAMKQVPTCEYFPFEAVRTNIQGAENIVRAIQEYRLPVQVVVGISTDKACKPVNAMGMTKALQERIFVQGNMRCGGTRLVCVRYGNVLASRGSVIPLFHEQIRKGGPVTITTTAMTRFLLSLDDAVDTVFAAVKTGLPGDTYVPTAPSARVVDIAKALIGDLDIDLKIVGIRPGEKIHEIMVSEEEGNRTVRRGAWYAIRPMLPEVRDDHEQYAGNLGGEYSSARDVMTLDDTRRLLQKHNLMPADVAHATGEVLR